MFLMYILLCSLVIRFDRSLIDNSILLLNKLNLYKYDILIIIIIIIIIIIVIIIIIIIIISERCRKSYFVSRDVGKDCSPSALR